MSRAAPEPDATWSVIIPVKDTSVAKTRLTGLSQRDRATLALAFAIDVTVAALACHDVRLVVAVTNDDGVSDALAALGASVVPDRPASDLNTAVEHGVRWVRRDDPAAAVAALQGDLPALRAADLAQAFAIAGSTPRWFVADADGTGTTLLAANTRAPLRPSFGTSSRHEHLAGGAIELVASGLERLRRDVDSENHLWEAVRLGVGSHTRAAMADLDASLCPRA